MPNINTILITGASRGLGHALATRFAQTGHTVLAVGRDAMALEHLQANYPKFIQAIVADITTEAGREAIYKHVMHAAKPLSIIHNAAIAETCALSNINDELFQTHFATNVFAPLLITQQCLPLLTTGQRILHISSAAAVLPLEHQLLYCTSKAALEHASRCLNTELNERGVYSGILWPGVMTTPMQEKLCTEGEPAAREFYIKLREQKQSLQPELVAEFTEWVLLKTTNQDFSTKTWNIYDVEQHPNWLPTDALPPSYNVI